MLDAPGWAATDHPGPRQPDPLTQDAQLQDPAGQLDQGAAVEASGSRGTSIPAFFKERSAAYAAIAGTLLDAVGGWLNSVSAAHDEDEAFLPDEDDRKMIPPPLGRLAARRVKIGGSDDLRDVEDVGMALVGVAAWLAKGFAAALKARRELKRAQLGAMQGQETDQ